MTQNNHFGLLLKEWRNKRNMSQLDLAGLAEISTRHLSFLETGRSKPSREMIEILGGSLDLPLPMKNAFYEAAGYSANVSWDHLNEPKLWAAKKAIQKIIVSHEPFPALAIDRHWNLIVANQGALHFMEGLPEKLLVPPINVMRLTLHPEGLSSKIVNYWQWREHLLERLENDLIKSQDPVLRSLKSELVSYPAVKPLQENSSEADHHEIAVPLKLKIGDRILSFISTITIFGSPQNIALSGIALETFFPLDVETLRHLNRLASRPRISADSESKCAFREE